MPDIFQGTSASASRDACADDDGSHAYADDDVAVRHCVDDGLADRKRSGRPRVLAAPVVAEVRAMACEPPQAPEVPLSRRNR
jgi:hypothetical protein